MTLHGIFLGTAVCSIKLIIEHCRWLLNKIKRHRVIPNLKNSRDRKQDWTQWLLFLPIVMSNSISHQVFLSTMNFFRLARKWSELKLINCSFVERLSLSQMCGSRKKTVTLNLKLFQEVIITQLGLNCAGTEVACSPGNVETLVKGRIWK